MRIRIGLLVLISALFMAAPGQAQTGNPLHDALSASPPAQQRSQLLRLVQADGQLRCSDVISDFSAGLDQHRTAYWDLRCREGTMIRVALPSVRWARPSMLLCGAQAEPPAGGPCFRPVASAMAQSAPPAPDAAVRQQCQATCTASQPGALVQACTQRCIVGGGVEVGPQVAATLPANSRFGVVYSTDAPLAALGFGNGNIDRLAVNLAAARACQGQAGRTPCKFRAELVNACGAVAMAISRHPSAMVMTSDLTTQVLNRLEVGTGATRAAAEEAAMAACRVAEQPGVQCRIAASGC
ncbi:DUF4189 domain-containing protein [Rhodovarius crocodyli]|uniref:DUF4189 domain-containing protein n=1 Tax=Rhodovarius crocodyli TaxID=1979269 RepID=A0A437LX54_9PROT|nr:DUF4189 domain-containing protein [Rhodovarius crocodyli]RVT89917.1 DUF4189 domain-containing protein [Rhodovarius crocodyli]